MANQHDDGDQPSNDWHQSGGSGPDSSPQGGPKPRSAPEQSPGDDHPDPMAGQSHDQPPMRQPGSGNSQLQNDDILAIVLSIFFPGVGQIMRGQTTKGIVILAVSIFTCAAGGLLSIASGVDAFCLIKAKKKRPVGEWEFFPDINDAF